MKSLPPHIHAVLFGSCQATLRRMIAVSHSAATSPRSMASLTAASLPGPNASRGGDGELRPAAGRRNDASMGHRGSRESGGAAASLQHSTPPASAQWAAARTMTWASATPGVSIAAAAAAALAAAATPAEPFGALMFSDSDEDEDSSIDGSRSELADGAGVDVAGELLSGSVGSQLPPAISNYWLTTCEVLDEVSETGGDAAVEDDAAAVRAVGLSADGVATAACQTAAWGADGDSPSQPEDVQLQAEWPATDAAAGSNAVHWVAADVAGPNSDTTGERQVAASEFITSIGSPRRDLHQAGGCVFIPGSHGLPRAEHASEDSRSPHTPLAESSALLPLLSRPSRIPRPPSGTPTHTSMVVSSGEVAIAALKDSVNRGSPADSKGQPSRYSEGRACGDVAGSHKQMAAAAEVRSCSAAGDEEDECSIAAVFSELALVAKLEAASSWQAIGQQASGVRLALGCYTLEVRYRKEP